MYKIQKELKLIDHRTNNKFYLYNGTNDLTFKTLDEAVKHLNDMGINYQVTKQTYEPSGVYVTSWGEYDRPLYHIRKMKTKK